MANDKGVRPPDPRANPVSADELSHDATAADRGVLKNPKIAEIETERAEAGVGPSGEGAANPEPLLPPD